MIYGLPFQGASYPVTSGFGPRNSPTAGASSYHWGYDFGTPLGTPLYAPAGATVDFMGADTADLDGDGVPDGLGNYLRLLMPGGEQMYYGHLDRFAPGLEVGATIDPGTLLAYTGSSGISTGPHLDIRMRDAEGNRIDPTPYLGIGSPLNTEAQTPEGAALLDGVAGHVDPYTVPAGAGTPGHPVDRLPENAISDSYNTWIAPNEAPQGQTPMLGLLNDNQITGGLLGSGQQDGGFMSGVNMPLLMAGAQILANSGPSLEPRSMFEGVPNALMGGVQAQEAQRRAQEERQRRMEREQAQQRLMQSGLLSPEMQAAVEAGYGDQVMAGLFGQPEVPSLVRTAEALGIPLDDPRLHEAFLNTNSGTSVNVNMPPTYPDPPAGFLYDYNESGIPVAARPIPGTEQAREIEQEEAQTQRREEDQQLSTDLMISHYDNALGILENSDWATGVPGMLTSGIPGSSASYLSNALAPLASQVAAGELQNMRNNSPTGGALGNVTERELDLLSQLRGNISQSQTAEELRYNLIRARNYTLDLIHGVGNGPNRMELPPVPGSAPAPTTPGSADNPAQGANPQQWPAPEQGGGRLREDADGNIYMWNSTTNQWQRL